MEFIDIATEQTTAATNALIVVLMIVFIVNLHRTSTIERWKSNIWKIGFSLMATAAFFGVLVHGFKMSENLQFILWQPLYLTLGLLMALFVVAAIYDIWGYAMAKRALPFMVVVGFLFFGFTLLWPDNFRVFIIYEAIAMLFALVGYIWLAVKGRLKGALWMASGVLVTIIAAAVQATKVVAFSLIWDFDHNGAFHIIQIMGMLLLFIGISKSLRSPE